MKIDNGKRFVLVMGIIFVLSGINLIYLYTFSNSSEIFVIAVTNLALGIIFIISYKSPKLLKIIC
jgi:hypothetical protein